MAGPIAHIFCALAFLNSNYNTIEDKQAFLLGTSFPDIRYLGVIERTQTHIPNIKWDDVVNEKSAFKAGLLFHSLVDQAREGYFESHGLYDIDIGVHPQFRSHVLKLFEDILLHDSISEWPKIVAYFDDILQEERAYPIAPESLQNWHAILQIYCAKKPGIHTLISFANNNQIKKKMGIEKLSQADIDCAEEGFTDTFNMLNKNETLIKIIHDFYSNCITILQSY